MPRSVAIIGSGIAGTTIAHLLTQRGHKVTMFEAGPAYPYPHAPQYTNEILHLYRDPKHTIADDLRHLELSGNATDDRLVHEQIMVVGGMATRWSAWTPRYMPHDFKSQTLLGHGVDWPITYDELEPYFCKAEQHLSISGTDDDNPFAPRRSRPLPLPPFPLAADDVVLGERLKSAGILLHTVPQARTSGARDGRPACANMRVCGVCPIGARYSPNHHLAQALETGRLTLHTSSAVRAIASDRSGVATSIVYHANNEAHATEEPADVVVLAAGALESARLLLLSARDGKAAFNPGQHVGRHLMFDRIYGTYYRFDDKDMLAGRAGPRSAQSYQFMTPRKELGNRGYKVDFSSSPLSSNERDSLGRGSDAHWLSGAAPLGEAWQSADEVLREREYIRHTRVVAIHCGTTSSDEKYVELSAKTDRFGVPFSRVHHDANDFDLQGHDIAEKLVDQIGKGVRASVIGKLNKPSSGHHHLGTCRMGTSAANSVVDSFGKVHGFSNLFVAGASTFPSSSASNPTLTLVALAIRTAELIAEKYA